MNRLYSQISNSKKLISYLLIFIGISPLTACIHRGSNPADPYESINRKIYAFNTAFDATLLKPPARLYKAVVPPPVRTGMNNFYDNINMIPTVANDLLQTEWHYAIKDSWRFIINSTFGLAGILDAASTCGLPPRSNDLGITLAKWGDKNSPFIMIPFLGPSTMRDGMGMMFEYALLTPYPYIRNDAVLYSLLGLRYVELRAQLLETEKYMDQAIDKYAFLRDAYLQHRNYRIFGENKEEQDVGSLYVDDDDETVNITDNSSDESQTANDDPKSL